MTKLVYRAPKDGGSRGRGGAGRGGGGGGGGGRGKTSSSQPTKTPKNQSWKEGFREKFKWKGRAGKAVRARSIALHPALKPLAKGRELTPAEVSKMLRPVLQPVKAKYSGQGLAKPSVFIDIAAEDFRDRLRELYDEHVEGFSGKSYKKMGNAQENMLWRQRLKAKAEMEGTAVVKRRKHARRPEEPEDDDDGASDLGAAAVSAGGVHWRRKEAVPAVDLGGERRRRGGSSSGEGGEEGRAGGGATEAPAGAAGGLSRKQRKKAAQMGLTPEAMLELQTSKVRIEVDDDLRHGAIEAYRAMQKAKMQRQKGNGSSRR